MRKKFHSRQQLRKNLTKLVLCWRYFQENQCFDLHRNRRCLHNQSKMQQNATVVHKPSSTDREAILNFMNWCIHRAHGGEIKPALILFSTEALFGL